MPRRATKTSYGQEQGNRPKGNDQARPGPGAPPQTMRDRMKLILDRAKTIKAIEAVLEDPTNRHFSTVLTTVLDRTEGKVPTAVDLTSKGEKVSGVVVLPATEDPKS